MNGISIGVVCSVVGAVVGILGFIRFYNKDTQEEASCNTKLGIDMEYIKRGVDDIRLDIKAQDRKISDVIERVVRVEESTKSAHHRIDGLEREE